MPIYEYRCESCEHEFDVLHPMSAKVTPVDEPCPKCGEKKVSRLFSVPLKMMEAPIKVPSAFKEVISKIKAQNPKNTIRDY